MSSFRLFLLGPPRLERDGGPLKVEPRKNVALLAYLAVTGEGHSREALVTLLWPELEPSRARAGLRRNLSILKKTLAGEWLLVERETISLDRRTGVCLDVDEFHRLLQGWQTHGHAEADLCADCLTALAEAVELYRGDFLAGFSLPDSANFDEWQFFQTESLRQELATALERLVRGHSAQGGYAVAIPYARRWLALDPLYEPVQRQLMQLYARTGQQAAALRQYAECERLLQEELGVLPDEETVQLYQAIKKKRPLPPPSGQAPPSRGEPLAQEPPARAVAQRERYRPERKVGAGSMGEVWLATDTILNRPVALKFPKVVSAIAAERLLQEARLLATLNHPNITAIYDFFIDPAETRFYLVMEHVDGKALSELIRGDPPLSLDLILEIATGVLQALSYAHAQGIVHRDVKPANVFIADDVKLGDFGLSSMASLLERGTGMMAGTPAYMAPEQVEGRPTDGRADLYALGVMLFEMITGGQLPFAYTDEDEMMAAQVHEAPPPLSQFAPAVPPALEQIIMRLLAKEPKERYPSAEVVLEELGSLHLGPTAVSNLPLTLTPFVGREAELAEIKDRLQDPDCRLLSLVGPGGSGKTRLALEAAAGQLDNFAHGVFFVNLAPLETVEAIVPTVAKALDFSFYEGGTPHQQLLDYLRQKNMLLIMDNFEHLLDGVGLVIDILTTASEVKILATSRARLNVQGEQLFPISGMDFPDQETVEDATRYSAVKLFLGSARRIQPGFAPTVQDMTDITHICRLVEGMPLGIELAAAWTEALTLAEIATEISQSFDFLETELRDVPERQRSIRAVFDHSWRLLTDQERKVIQGLSVFRGGFTREAAQEVVGASLRELMTLVNKSLLQRTSVRRYGMHELLRQYAAEKLDLSPVAKEAVRDRHCAYYAAALQQWGDDLKGPRQQTALAKMDAEIENARFAWNWAAERGQVERLDQVVDGLCLFYEWRGRYQEGEAVCQTAVKKLASTVSGSGLRSLAKILTWQSRFSQILDRTESASQLLQQSLALLDSPELAGQDTRPEKAFVLLEMGDRAVDSDSEEARQLAEHSLALYRELDDQWGTADALDVLTGISWSLGTYDEARQFAEESFALRQTLGDQKGIARSLRSLGDVANFHMGQLEEGETLITQALAIRQEIGDRAGMANDLHELAVTLAYRGKFIEALALCEKCVAIRVDLGLRGGYSSVAISVVEVHLGWYEQAGERARTSLDFAREIGHQQGIGFSLFALGSVALAEEAYAEAQDLFQESVAVYREMGHRMRLGFALASLGYAARRLGQLSQARQYLSESLQTAVELGAFVPLMVALPVIALLVADQGEQERAVELYALASRHGFVANSHWFEDVAGKHIAAVAATLPPDVVAAAQERGKARDLWGTAAELLAELEGMVGSAQ